MFETPKMKYSINKKDELYNRVDDLNVLLDMRLWKLLDERLPNYVDDILRKRLRNPLKVRLCFRFRELLYCRLQLLQNISK